MSQIRRGGRGAKFVDGDTDETARVVLTREDGSQEPAPILIFSGSIVDNGDGTATITT